MAARNLGLDVANEQVAILRRCGYPDAYIEREYCFSEVSGEDNLVIQASIRLGTFQERAIPSWIKGVIEKARLKS